MPPSGMLTWAFRLLLPPAAIVPDQSQEMVMTVAADGSVVPKPVETGPLSRDGLRVISSGLLPTDQVIINGLMRSRPGTKVTPQPGSVLPSTGPAAAFDG